MFTCYSQVKINVFRFYIEKNCSRKWWCGGGGGLVPSLDFPTPHPPPLPVSPFVICEKYLIEKKKVLF